MLERMLMLGSAELAAESKRQTEASGNGTVHEAPRQKPLRHENRFKAPLERASAKVMLCSFGRMDGVRSAEGGFRPR